VEEGRQMRDDETKKKVAHTHRTTTTHPFFSSSLLEQSCDHVASFPFASMARTRRPFIIELLSDLRETSPRNQSLPLYGTIDASWLYTGVASFAGLFRYPA